MTGARRALTLEDVRRCFEEVVELEGCRFEPDAVLGVVVPIDSAEFFRILERVRRRHGIRPRPEELAGVRTLGDLLAGLRGERT